jgi:hypothetical protein
MRNPGSSASCFGRYRWWDLTRTEKLRRSRLALEERPPQVLGRVAHRLKGADDGVEPAFLLPPDETNVVLGIDL